VTAAESSVDDERQLLRRAQRGDRFAFGLLVERHQDRLYTVATRMLGSRDDAADVVQEALIRAWTGLPRFRGDARFSTWLHRILLNAVYDHHARRRPTTPIDEAHDPADPRDRIAEHELSDELQRALAALGEDFRIPVLLADIAGLSYDEIAESLSIPLGTVRSRIFRGRAELARLLGTESASGRSEGR
jgi:RNA polymerase sigma-70 factor, ECF subfamily